MVGILGCLVPALIMSAFTAALFSAGQYSFSKKNSPAAATIKAAVMVALPAFYALYCWFQLGSAIVTTFVEPSGTPQHVSVSDTSDSSGPWGVDETTDEVIGSTSRTVYWVPSGKSYHFSRSCPSLSRSNEIESGTLQEARDEGKTDPCNNCVK